jgi:ABC-2 type transport system ATP-binding protein
MKAIETEGLTKLYGATRALDGVTLALEENRIYGLLGRNGAGKTTLLNTLTDKIFASSGGVEVFGVSACGSAEAQAKMYYMTEKSLYPHHMRVKDAFRYTADFYPEFDAAYAQTLAEKFALGVKKSVNELSTGYGSIFKLILALASGAPILLFDEPVLGLDANHRELFYRELLLRYSEKPSTIVISTHLIEEVAEVLEEAVIIHRGRILLQKSVEELLRSAYTVSGDGANVDAFTAGRKVAGADTMGRFKAVTVLESPDEAARKAVAEKGLDIASPTLQKLFVAMTND